MYKRTKFHIYGTESENEYVKVLETPEPLNFSTCIARLPNGELLSFGNDNPTSGLALIIDWNFKIRELPSGTPCHGSSAILSLIRN
ncbi:unnamed protein product [Blepharisma stoltei]|uniref:Uncharacterized protein n=1 Tax=Blepharisma stoltei TaxID=1481888 RepID=A0AAU9IK35_9CILI|nr:unnamed protein product [Blepharisma stoltei]